MTTALLFPTLGPMELVLILVIVLVLFGASRLGELGKGAGEAFSNFKKALSDGESSTPTEDVSEEAKPPAKAD